MIPYPVDAIRGQRVLVTGGLGFCGLNLSRSLAEDLECDVTILDDRSNSTTAPRLPARCTVVIGDVREERDFAPLVLAHPWVFHLACRTILTCGSDPESDLTVNALSTLRMLEFLRRERPPSFQRFLYTSSVSLYGNSRHLPADELDPPSILNHYAATKLLGEQYSLLYHTAYGLPTTCVRYSNVYGPGQTPRNPYCGVVGKFIDACLEGRPLTIHGDGEQTRDYTFVTDAVEATILAAVSAKAVGDVFNIGSGIETSVNTLAQEIRLLAQSDQPVEYLARRDIDNVRRRSVNPEKIRVRLGWVPAVRLRDGLRETIAWARAERERGDRINAQA
jgi:UDP-glucose 4-epimerase